MKPWHGWVGGLLVGMILAGGMVVAGTGGRPAYLEDGNLGPMMPGLDLIFAPDTDRNIRLNTGDGLATYNDEEIRSGLHPLQQAFDEGTIGLKGLIEGIKVLEPMRFRDAGIEYRFWVQGGNGFNGWYDVSTDEQIPWGLNCPTASTCTFYADDVAVLSIDGTTGKLTNHQNMNHCVDAAANDTYACAMAPALTSYVAGALYSFDANTANTGAASVNFNALGAKTIKKVAGGITTDLADNDIRAGQFVLVQYDGTNMQIQSTLGNAAAGGGAPTDATYITQTANGTLSAEQALSSLSTGYMKVTTGTGAITSQATPIPVADGGSGAATLTGVLKGNGTSAFTAATAGTDYVTPASTETLTNKTLDAEGTGNLITVRRPIWLPAAGCNNATAAAIWDLPAASPAVAACVTGTNTQKGVLDFADALNLSAQQSWALPTTWTGNIDVRIKWFSATTGAVSVVWQLQVSCVADAETDDPSWDTDVLAITDATKGTTNQTNDATGTLSTASHLSGCAAGEFLHLKLFRDSAHASDTMAGTARLLGLELTLREAL